MVCLLASQDEKTVAMLRKSLDSITMERDAAFISRVRGDIGYLAQSWAICSTLGKIGPVFLSISLIYWMLEIWLEQEDMVAQLRLMKRRLQEAEEEQYKVSFNFLLVV